MLARCRLLQAAALWRQKLEGDNPFFLWQVSLISLRSRGPIGCYQGPTGAAAVAAGVPRRPTDGSDGFPGSGKGLT